MERKEVGIPVEIIGFVIGKKHQNLNRIRKETGAIIEVKKDKIFVSGGQQECKDAIKRLKTCASEKLYDNLSKKHFTCERYDFVEGSGGACDFSLQLSECTRENLHQGQEYFRLQVEEEEGMMGAYRQQQMDKSDFNNFIRKVLQNIQNVDESYGDKMPKADFWCHFGHLCITGNVDEVEQTEIYQLKDLQKKFNGRSGWKMLFDSCVANMEVKNLEEVLSNCEYETIPPHIRYDLSFITPSCGIIRAKFFLDLDGKPNMDFANHEIFIDTKEDPSSSPSRYILCDQFFHRAKINIAIPSSAMDVRIGLRTVHSPSLDMKERDHEETLRKYLDKITFSDKGEIILPDDRDMPNDFVLKYNRKCHHRFYSYTDTGEEDSYIITISKEEVLNGANKEEVKTDVHLYSDQCNRLLRSEDWQPEQIITKLPSFLSTLRDIQENISNSG